MAVCVGLGARVRACVHTCLYELELKVETLFYKDCSYIHSDLRETDRKTD